MKSVLISIRPRWCEKIVSGEKTIEVRKSAPKEVPFKAYIYCAKEKKQADIIWAGAFGYRGRWNEHVIGEFVCDSIEDFSKWEFDYSSLLRHINLYAGTNGDYKFLDNYLKGEKYGYGWHISDLKIYYKPKELSDFKAPPCEKSEKECGNCKWLVKRNTPDVYECECYVENGRKITRPPQSYMFVEEVK